ncbi:MAG: DUF2911 domain-containing protein [Ginsengibacter sp.]
MKKLFAVLVLFISMSVSAQMNASQLPPLDKSPMDMSYYPSNYPILKIQDKVTEPLVMRIIYSRPQLNGRRVFGELQEYGNVWRLGANEATEMEFFKDVKIDGRKIKKGRYTVYAVPYSDKWTFIINKETDIWGSFKYEQSKDIFRVDLPVIKNPVTEAMTIVFDKTTKGADMDIFWDDVKVTLPIEF